MTARQADHPHARGENLSILRPAGLMFGPSPRAWGEPRPRQHRTQSRRTIPTRVGRTSPGTKSNSESADHPHARGENLSILRPAGLMFGPSPRAWGEPRPRQHRTQSRRTIPTRVGRTSPGTKSNSESADHPHARGENLSILRPAGLMFGPSPRAWGEPRPRQHRTQSRRTIPTRVGRTSPGTKSNSESADHPHARGEN